MALTRDEVFWSAFRNHAEHAVKAAGLLEKLVTDPAGSLPLVKEIRDLEHAADMITHQVLSALHQTWITPLDREEIHLLITRLDDVLDFIEAAAVRIEMYDIRESRPEAVDLAKALGKCTTDVLAAVSMLTSMKDPKPLLELCIRINEHEHEADEAYRRGIARLFRERTDPLEVMKWRDVLDSIEEATDRAEDVANILEGIVLEHA